MTTSTTIKTTIPLILKRNNKTARVFAPVPPPEEMNPLGKGQRPTKKALALANALMLERKLMDGTYRSLAEARRKLGFTRSIQDRLFRLLALPPEEMERILFETY